VNDQQHRATDCPHRELAVGWALHALEAAGDSLVAAHMPDCPICTSTATQTEEIGHTRPIRPAGNPQRRAGAAGPQRHGCEAGNAGPGTGTLNTASTTHHQANLAPRQKLATAIMRRTR